MTSAVLFESPNQPDAWLRWSFHHRDSHDRIRQAIAAKSGSLLFDYPIDPIDARDIGDFLQFNSQLHSDMNGALRLQSVDLLDVSFDDDAQRLAWIAQHAEEHRNAELALGI